MLSEGFPWLFCGFLGLFRRISWVRQGQKILGNFEDDKNQGKEGQGRIQLRLVDVLSLISARQMWRAKFYVTPTPHL